MIDVATRVDLDVLPPEIKCAFLQGYYQPLDGGGGIYMRDVDGSWVHNEVTSRDVINVRAFGASEDQSAEVNSAAVEAAINIMKPGHTLYFSAWTTASLRPAQGSRPDKDITRRQYGLDRPG